MASPSASGSRLSVSDASSAKMATKLAAALATTRSKDDPVTLVVERGAVVAGLDRRLRHHDERGADIERRHEIPGEDEARRRIEPVRQHARRAAGPRRQTAAGGGGRSRSGPFAGLGKISRPCVLPDATLPSRRLAAIGVMSKRCCSMRWISAPPSCSPSAARHAACDGASTCSGCWWWPGRPRSPAASPAT